MKIAATEFDLYEYQSPRDVEMVFCIKEAKALLAFCEATDVDTLVLYFYSGGRPIMFTCDGGACSGEVVLATMEPRGLDMASQRSVLSEHVLFSLLVSHMEILLATCSEYTYEPSLSNGRASDHTTIQNTQASRSSSSHVLPEGDDAEAEHEPSADEPTKRSRVDPRARLFDSDDSDDAGHVDIH